MRHLVRDLASRRYAALSALMIVVAGICILAGTWQISRYDSKHLDNDELRANAHDAATAVASVLPVVGRAPTPTAEDVEFRTVTATGSYDAADQLLVRRSQVDDTNGYLVLTPLRTDSAVLLVVRGFVADTTETLSPADVPAPPAGEVTVTARVQASQAGNDKFTVLHHGQVELVNAASAAGRLGTDVYAGYVELEADQAGTAGLVAIPAPDLSNPAGGAFELQHLAYIVQWYLFAALALAAPVIMLRTDRKRASEEARAIDALHPPAALPPGDAQAHHLPVRQQQTPSERLAERYGR